MGRRTLIIILLFLSLLYLPVNIFAAAVSIPDTDANPLDTIEIPVNIDDVSAFAGFQLSITYDPSVLQATGALVGELTSYGWIVIHDTSSPGLIKVSGFDQLLSGTSGTETSITKLQFTVVGNEDDSTNLDFVYNMLSDINGTEIPSASTPGYFCVRGLSCGDPDISVLPASFDFGDESVNQSSPPQVFTISNIGNVDLVISSITITGADASMFSVSAGTCAGLTPTIGDGESCTIEAIFLPSSEGQKSADIAIESNDPDTATLNISVSGRGMVDPSPDIKANGSDGPISVRRWGGNLSVTIELDSGSYSGENVDMWVMVDSLWGWYYYDPSINDWISTNTLYYQGPLSDISPTEVADLSDVFLGTYIFYFKVDTNMNGILDTDQMFEDIVVVNVTW